MPAPTRSLLLLLTLLVALPAAAQESAGWDFIESLGGLRVGAPEPLEEGGWRLPLECDLTGLRRITTTPTALNTTLVIDRIDWRLEEQDLLISLSLKGSPYATDESRCQPLTLTELRPGNYLVHYADGARRIALGEINLRR